jgi:nucleotide-binding universal stress UspA family protein
MFQRLVVPLDGSPLAEMVLPFAMELAAKFNAEIILVRVVPMLGQVAAMTAAGDPVASGADAVALTQALQEEEAQAERYLDAVMAGLQAKGLHVQWDVRRGAPGEEVIACARDHNADLIAISTHGRSGLGRLLLGSVADHVVRQAHLPVLLIRPEKVPAES